MNADNYITIQGWMRTDLDLKGNELLVYAIIYGFSQAENQVFNGSLQYLADWCGATKQGILKNLKSLIDKNLITKNETIVNGVKYCEYSCMVLNSVEYPIKHSLTNNIANNIDNKTILSKDNIVEDFQFGTKQTKPKKPTLYDKCVIMIENFTDDAILRELLVSALKVFLENSRESGHPMYTNQFKGKLNTLKRLSNDNYIQRKIVQQTLDNGWNNFYELKTNNNKKNNTHERLNESGDLYVEHSNRRKEGRLNGEKF